MSKAVAFISMKHGTPYNTVEFRWPTRTEVPGRIRQLTPQQLSIGLELVANTVDLLENVEKPDKNLDKVRELEKELTEMRAKYDSLEVSAMKNREQLLELHNREIDAMKSLYEDVIRKFERALVECKVSLSNIKLEKEGVIIKNELSNLVEDGLNRGLEGISIMLADVVTDAIKTGLSVKYVKPSKK